jgi:hypothetical protein
MSEYDLSGVKDKEIASEIPRRVNAKFIELTKIKAWSFICRFTILSSIIPVYIGFYIIYMYLRANNLNDKNEYCESQLLLDQNQINMVRWSILGYGFVVFIAILQFIYKIYNSIKKIAIIYLFALFFYLIIVGVGGYSLNQIWYKLNDRTTSDGKVCLTFDSSTEFTVIYRCLFVAYAAHAIATLFIVLNPDL